MLGKTHIVYVCFFRAGVRQEYWLFPECEAVNAVIAFCYCEKGFSVPTLNSSNNIEFSVKLNSTCIESGFGKNKLSPTGAIGTFQQTGAYRDANWSKHGAFIAQHVPEARAAMEGGLSKDEKRSLAFNDRSAAIMTALAAKSFAESRGLDLNDKKNWWVVYAEHNAGAGSVNKILRNEMPDKFIRDCNPAIYRGKDTPTEVVANYQSKIMGYAKAYEKLETNLVASAKVDATLAIANASASSAQAVKTTPKVDLAAPELKPA